MERTGRPGPALSFSTLKKFPEAASRAKGGAALRANSPYLLQCHSCNSN